MIENSNVPGLDATPSLRGRPYSVLCVPIADALTGGVVAVLYLQNEARRAFEMEDLEWLTAYAAALGQAVTLHDSGQRRVHESGGWHVRRGWSGSVLRAKRPAAGGAQPAASISRDRTAGVLFTWRRSDRARNWSRDASPATQT